MLELPPEYLNKIADQIIVISSLLGGFSIAVMANMIIDNSKSRLSNAILKVTAVAASSFLITLFAMTKIVLMTTEGFPLDVDNSDLNTPRIMGISAFIIGLITLSALIALSGWVKSKKVGIFTTVIGIITFIMIVLNL